jgi:membrane-associated protein
VRITHEYYERHGGKTIVMAQFIPILRTFAPVVAGVGEMGYRSFATYNIVGAILWIGSMTLAGYTLGNLVPNIESRIHYVVAVVIGLSLLPPAIGWLRGRRRGKASAVDVIEPRP